MRFFTKRQKKKWMETAPKRMSSSVLVLENQAGEVLIVKANYKPYWTFPGGIIDFNETPKQAAIRETHEEIGIVIDEATVSFVAIVDRISNEAQTYQFIFKAPLHDHVADSIMLQASEMDEFALVNKTQVGAADRHYAKAIQHWAQGIEGYVEQTFEEGGE